jgi:hypothetical protein
VGIKSKLDHFRRVKYLVPLLIERPECHIILGMACGSWIYNYVVCNQYLSGADPGFQKVHAVIFYGSAFYFICIVLYLLDP